MATRTYKLFANALASVHFLWTLFLIGGTILMLAYPPYAPTQIIAMSFTLLLAIPFGRTCPLTLFEEKLRRKFDPGYRNYGSFIATYLNKLFKTRFTTQQINRINAGLYVIAFAIAIAILILRQ